MSAYSELEEKARLINHLQEVEAINEWDVACMMPAGGSPGRSRALATLAGVIHERVADPKIGELLNKARSDGPPLDPWQSANLAAIEKSFVEASAVPKDLVQALRHSSLQCEQAWREARIKNNWPGIQSLLEEVVNLQRQKADALADAMSVSRYNALLEVYEPELRVADIEPVFEDLKKFLPELLEKVLDRQTEPEPLEGPFDIGDQRRLCEKVMKTLGFDQDRGRFDVSHHPFCAGVPDDTRITTRYNEHSFLGSFMAICHETGHALYQQGLPVDWRDQPVGEALGAAVHESQSLLMELQVCRGRQFIEFMAPTMRTMFGRAASDTAWSPDNLYRHATRVERSFIRVDADEVTYPLHVILRFELERELLDGTLAVADLPEAWDAAMNQYLGLSTKGDDANGCMQDVHWYAGLFGYFPTYTLGALAAAQWFETAKRDIPAILPSLKEGDFTPLLGWLRKNIHSQGRLTSMQPLLEGVTGSRLDARFFKRHLETRYLGNL